MSESLSLYSNLDLDLHLNLALFLPLFLTGLLGSLHCVGMCGPLLIAFGGSGDKGWMGWRGLLACHAGRVWTYAMLGLLAGLAGAELRQHAALLGWQRPLAVLAGIGVMLAGVATLGWLPGTRASHLPACLAPVGGWLGALRRESSPAARLLLGALMGLMPCGLVYAALFLAATLPSPLASALGMMFFGVGTLPALTGTAWVGRLLPLGWRRYSPRFAAAVLLMTGLVMLGRGLLVEPSGATDCPLHGSESAPYSSLTQQVFLLQWTVTRDTSQRLILRGTSK